MAIDLFEVYKNKVSQVKFYNFQPSVLRAYVINAAYLSINLLQYLETLLRNSTTNPRLDNHLANDNKPTNRRCRIS